MEASFVDFQKIQNSIELYKNPLLCNLKFEDKKVQMELDLLQKDTLLPLEQGIDFWRQIDKTKYPMLKNKIYQLFSMYGTTYGCDMSFIKNKYRHLLTNQHLENLLRIKTSEKEIDFDELVMFSKP